MHYLDTSILAPIILEEASSYRVETKLLRLPAGSLWISQWTQVEFSSLIAREVRMQGLAPDQANLALQQFDELCGKSLVVLPPGPVDFELASRYIRNFKTKLRSGDALHLAIAHNNKATVFHSLDKALIQAARLLKFKTSTA